MPKLITLIVADLETTPLGLPSRVGGRLGGQGVLARTLRRLAKVEGAAGMVVIHPLGQNPRTLLGGVADMPRGLQFLPVERAQWRPAGAMRAARVWALGAWRGGLGGATCYDELLPAGPLLAALERFDGSAALLVGGDWPLVDPDLCRQVIERHLSAPEAMQLTFTQAPPGLAGCVVSRELLQQFHEKQAGIGRLLAYVPARPQPDPIGRDVCVQVPAAVRQTAQRFIFDTPRSVDLLTAVAARLGEDLDEANAEAVTAAARAALEAGDLPPRLPQEVTLELTPDRRARGPITPHHHVSFPRQPMPLDLALAIVRQLGQAGDVALTLGGLGDALLHPHWAEVVQAARQAGVLAVRVETDLLEPPAALAPLLDLPVDVVSVRLNADCGATYETVMFGADPEAWAGPGEGPATPHWDRVAENLQTLLKERRARGAELPWVVPHLIKTAQTLKDMETFFDRWMQWTGQAVIEGPTTGCGLMPEQGLVRMAPPVRVPCRQLPRRMTILSDGTVARCDQDWLAPAPGSPAPGIPAPGAPAPGGHPGSASLLDLWQAMQPFRADHAADRWDQHEPCRKCQAWHRP